MAIGNEPIICTADSDKRAYSVPEVAELLNISRSKAYELCREDHFKVVRIGTTVRISRKSFDEWLDGGCK